jgi:hypothetical protein
MKDLISERDKKQKMARSIVKWWNVHYTTPEELEQDEASATIDESTADQSSNESEEPTQEESRTAQEIIERLNQEAQDDEEALEREIEQARQEADANLNQATGAPSGTYGSQGSDGEHKEQIEAILAEKDDALRDLIERTGDQE